MVKNSKSEAAKVSLRVIIADVSSAISQSLIAMLSDQENIQVVGCAHKSIETLSLIEREQPDVVLLDLHMAGESLVSMLHLMTRATSLPAVIVLAPYPSGVLRARCLEAGADYFFTRTTEFERITGTLQKLLAAKQSNQLQRTMTAANELGLAQI